MGGQSRGQERCREQDGADRGYLRGVQQEYCNSGGQVLHNNFVREVHHKINAEKEEGKTGPESRLRNHPDHIKQGPCTKDIP